MSMVTYSTMTGVQGEFYPCDAATTAILDRSTP